MMRYFALTLVLGSIAVGQPAPVAPAVTPAAPTTRPSPKPVAVDQTLNSMLHAPAKAAKPLDPVADPPATDITSVTSGGFAVAPATPSVSVMREGTTIVDRVGRLTR